MLNPTPNQNFAWVAIPKEHAWVIVFMAAPFVVRKVTGGSALRDGDTLRGTAVDEKRSLLPLLGVG